MEKHYGGLSKDFKSDFRNYIQELAVQTILKLC